MASVQLCLYDTVKNPAPDSFHLPSARGGGSCRVEAVGCTQCFGNLQPTLCLLWILSWFFARFWTRRALLRNIALVSGCLGRAVVASAGIRLPGIALWAHLQQPPEDGYHNGVADPPLHERVGQMGSCSLCRKGKFSACSLRSRRARSFLSRALFRLGAAVEAVTAAIPLCI